jgi:hypothetical protein
MITLADIGIDQHVLILLGLGDSCDDNAYISPWLACFFVNVSLSGHPFHYLDTYVCSTFMILPIKPESC